MDKNNFRKWNEEMAAKYNPNFSMTLQIFLFVGLKAKGLRGLSQARQPIKEKGFWKSVAEQGIF